MELGVDTPELDKQLEIIRSGKTEVLTDFYDWLREQGYWIAEVNESLGEFYPVSKTPEQLFADFFGVDLNKIEEERRAILEALESRSD